MKKRQLINREQCDVVIKKFNIKITGYYRITSDGRIDVEGDVMVRYNDLDCFPLRFRRINGSFLCGGINLKSLKFGPEYVRGDFKCNNNKLVSLMGGPQIVDGAYDCAQNKLIDLYGCASKIGGNFNCKLNKLKSLEGCPKDFNGNFNCSHNLLNDFVGVPQNFKGELFAYSNFLKNLKGLKKMDGTIHIDAGAGSINTGLTDCRHTKIKVYNKSKHGIQFMPLAILDNLQYLDVVTKYQQYYEIWNEADELHDEYFNMLIEDIKDGLL